MAATRHARRRRGMPSLEPLLTMDPARRREILYFFESAGRLRPGPPGSTPTARPPARCTAVVPWRPPPRQLVLATRLREHQAQVAKSLAPSAEPIALPASLPAPPPSIPGPEEIGRRYHQVAPALGTILDARA